MTVASARAGLALLSEWLLSFAAVALFVRVFGAQDGPAPSIIAVGAAVLLSFAFSRVLSVVDDDADAPRLVIALASVGALYVILRAEYAPDAWPWELGWLRDFVRGDIEGHANVLAGVVAMTAVWLRGIARGSRPLGEAVSPGVFAGGILVFAMVAAWSAPARGPDSFGALGVIYFVVTLAALALYRAADPGEALGSFAAKWGWTVGGVLGVAALLTVVAASVDPSAFGFLSPLGEPLRAGADAFGRYVLGPIFDGTLAFLRWLFQTEGREPPPQPQQPEQRTPMTDEGTAWWIRAIGFTLVGILLFVLLAGFVLLVWLLLERLRRKRKDVDERRDRLAEEYGLRDDLASMLDGVLRRFRRGASRRPAAEVRRLYHEMLDRAAHDGLQRPPSTTPLRFVPPLESHYASHVPGEITAAFVDSRYGDLEVEDERVRELRERWRQRVLRQGVDQQSGDLGG